MQDELRKVKERLDDNENRRIDSEHDTRALLVEPVLEALGWDVKDTRHVQRKYTTGRGRVDYVLFVDELPHVLIETKKLRCMDDAEKQIERYCRGTQYIGVATDGEYWAVFMDKLQPRIRIDKRGAGERLSRQVSRHAVIKYRTGQLEKHARDLINRFNKRVGKDMKSNAHDVNTAVREFSRYVTANRGHFDDPERFRKMVRAYLNILNYTSGEKDILRGVLESLELKTEPIERIMKNSKPGRYWALPRTLLPEYKRKDREAFLGMIDTALSDNSKPDDIYKTFDEFDQDDRNFGPAVLTGIVSALRPHEFMVYNKRSVRVLSKIVAYHSLVHVDMGRYKQFNSLYRQIGKLTGNGLIDLDVIANHAYEEDD